MRIHIDFVIPQRVKRILKIGAPLAVVLAASVVYANVPNTFKDGDLLSAQPMNDNFSSLDQRIAKLEAVSAAQTADGGYSLGATYCGASSNTTKGDLSGLTVTGTGYAKARTQCQVTCGATSAHMCTGDEVERSSQLGLKPSGAGWYSPGTGYPLGSVGYFDCHGWIDGTTAFGGGAWNSTPQYATCDTLFPVLCCN